MPGLTPYTDNAPERTEVDAMQGPLVLEFGSNGCGICRGTASIIAEAMQGITAPHLRIEDGKGRRLGRSFGIKLWPTLIALRDGTEVARVVRPTSVDEIRNVLQFVS